MSTHCQRCGRSLKDPKSRARGFGPICFEKFTQERLEMLGLDERPQEKPEGLNMPYEKVKVDDLRLDGGTQPRVEINQALVEEYAEDMAGGAIFPPVVVFYDGENYWLADGFHRVMAAALIEREDFYADLREGTLRDAILYSCGANGTHGLRRSNADKRAAVEKLLLDEEWSQWSDREISRRCGVSDKTVARLRSELELSAEIPQIDERKVQRGDTTYTMDTAEIGQREQPEEAGEKETGPPSWLVAYRALAEGADRVVFLATGESEQVLVAFDDHARQVAAALHTPPDFVHRPEWGGTVPLAKVSKLHKPTMNQLATTLGQYALVPNHDPELKHFTDTIMTTVEYAPPADGEDYETPGTEAACVVCGLLDDAVEGTPPLCPDCRAEGWHYEAAGVLAPGGQVGADEETRVDRDTTPEDWPEPASQPRGNHRIDPLMQSGSDEWYTPADLAARIRDALGGKIALDPCSTEEANQVVGAGDFWTKKDDGLKQSWYCATLFMNPPYGDQIGAWVEKLAEEFEMGRVRQAIALLPARTDTAWFRELRDHPRCFLHGRLQFWGPEANGNSATFPSVVVALGCDLDTFAEAFADVGDVYVRYVCEPVPLEEVVA